jgi:hypothetical protein
MNRSQAALKDVAGIEISPMDLLNPSSIDAFAKRFLDEHSAHILVNSGGVMAVPELTRDGRGHEIRFATNNLGHFQLTLRPWPALLAADGARVRSYRSDIGSRQ